LDENTLTFDYWDGSQWVNAATTCDPPSSYDRRPDENTLSVAICHLTEFNVSGQVGQPPAVTKMVYLPLVLR